MAAEAPALGEALVGHAHGAEPDFLDAGNVPAAMVEAGRGGFHQRQHMMIAAVDAVHERHQVGGAVGQAQAELALVEFDRGVDVAR